MHLKPDPAVDGHFNVLRGVVRPLGLAGVKVVGDFHGNYRAGLPSEMGLLALFDPGTGQPRAIVDAAGITDMRTGAVTALGARHLAPRGARVLGHIGARGTAYWNVRLLARVLDGLEEIRVHSRRPESREAFAARLEADLGRPVTVTEDWESCVRGADVVVEASRLEAPEPLLRTEWIAPGALVVPYGTMSAVELSLTSIMDKVVVDDWGQAARGRSARCAATSTRGSSPPRACTPSSARSSPGCGRAASPTTRRSCSGTAACRRPTWRWATRCSRRPSASASGSGCATAEPRRRSVRAVAVAAAVRVLVHREGLERRSRRRGRPRAGRT